MPRQDSHCLAPPLQTRTGSLRHIAPLTLEVGRTRVTPTPPYGVTELCLGRGFPDRLCRVSAWSRITRDDMTAVG